MQLPPFIEYHRPALETDEVKHNLILGLLGNASSAGLRLWTLNGPGSCALQYPDRPIVLGALTEPECRRLARETRSLAFPGVVGCDDTAKWFVDETTRFGVVFLEPIPQQIHVLNKAPSFPGAEGHARQVGAADTNLFVDWMLAFHEEATPHDPRPTHERLAAALADQRYFFWIVNGEPVSMAGIARRTRNTAAISGVYTPPSLRGRRYAGSVTAAVAEQVFAEGKRSVCLYTDLRNPYSNRCYAKIGFEPVCASYHYVRRQQGKA